MLTRILIVALVAMLAIPMVEATRPAQASTQVQEQVTPSIAAKKHKKKPKFTTITRTERQSVTQTFSNPTPITVPAAGTSGVGSLYSSTIPVSGLVNATITDVNLTLNGFSHTFPRDVDVLLAATHLPGLNAIVLSDVCGVADTPAVNLNLTLDDQAATALPAPTGQCVSGAFKPTDATPGDPFTAPAPTPSGNVLLSVFNGSNPNGAWQLFVLDDAPGATGQIARGWSLQITAQADVQVQEKVKVKKKKKR